MAPDFAGMAGVRLKIAPKSTTSFAQGVRLYYATDRVFNTLPEVRQLKHQARKLLATVQLTSGAKATVVEISAKLLLDGYVIAHYPDVLLKHNQAVTCFASAPAPSPAVIALSETGVLWQFAAKHLERGVPDYRLPYQIALQLHRRLKISRGLGFPPDLIPELASIMAAYQTEVHNASEALLAKTIAQLA